MIADCSFAPVNPDPCLQNNNFQNLTKTKKLKQQIVKFMPFYAVLKFMPY